MHQTATAGTRIRGSLWATALGAVIVTAALVGTLVYLSVSPLARSFSSDGAITEADGVLPDGVTVFDGEYPGVANLDPDLLHALREAATDAADEGVELYVNSGWRSVDYQNQLRREAISEYGSEAGAAQWVATADRSDHVSGDAVDVGSLDATAWLSAHGASYGLCQTYRNESWHYELRRRAIDRGCPAMYADPGSDPRMSQ